MIAPKWTNGPSGPTCQACSAGWLCERSVWRHRHARGYDSYGPRELDGEGARPEDVWDINTVEVA